MIEPTPSHIDVAQELFDIYNTGNIVLHNVAISDVDGVKNFCMGKINSTMNSFYQHHDHSEFLTVKTFKLKTFIKRLGMKIDFIKMDVEGSEQQIIMDEDFDSFIYDNVEEIYLEIHDSLGADYTQIYDKLTSLNYNIEKIKNDTLYAHK